MTMLNKEQRTYLRDIGWYQAHPWTNNTRDCLFELRQWQKLGSRIEEVIVKRMICHTGDIFDKHCEVI
ncbi:MAG: hypothetical protein R3C11_24875 [Planctomycetaceae bacterium]